MNRRAWLAFVVVSLCTVQSALSLSIVNVAFPDLETSFPDVHRSSLQWIVTSYTVVAAGSLVISGVISDRYGRKRTLVLGAAVFGLASLVCALSTSFELLIVGRCVQAVGSALLTPAGAALVVRAFPDELRSTAVGMWAAVGSVAAALGPSVGGLLVDAGGWRWAFWVHVPFTAIAVVLATLILSESRDEKARAIPDPLGAVMIVLAVSSLVLGISQSTRWGWTSPSVWALFTVGLVGGFTVVQRSRAVANPILETSLFQYSTFRWSNAASLVFGIGFFSTFFGYVLFLRDVWGESTRNAGLLLTPIPAVGAVLSAFVGRFADRRGERAPMILGSAVFAAGGLWLVLFVGDERQILTVWMPAVFLIGIGAGIAWPAVFGSVMVAIPQERYAAATGINQTAQRISNAVGVATVVALVDTSGTPDAALFRRLFLLTTASGLAAILVGTRFRRITPPPSPVLVSKGRAIARPLLTRTGEEEEEEEGTVLRGGEPAG
jgi:EmrB/QacA subfamily drug resistance transporter